MGQFLGLLRFLLELMNFLTHFKLITCFIKSDENSHFRV